MNPARRVTRKHAHDSHPNVSTCNTTHLVRAQSQFAPCDETDAEAGSKDSREARGKGFIAVRTSAAGSVPPVPLGMVRDCG